MKIINIIKKEKGAVEIVEAAFVFPIVIFVVIILIFFGNMLYQQSKVDAIAVEGAEFLAAQYAHPILQKENIPTNSTEVDVKPYRYLLGDAEAEEAAKEYINDLLDKTGTGLFSGMGINNPRVICEVKNYVVYQKACVQIEYNIELLPMRLIDGVELFKYSNATATTATDSAEFIRNVDMILDYSEQFGLTEKIQTMVGAFKGN